MNLKTQREKAAAEVKAWNEKHAVGTAVRYWPGLREGEGLEGKTIGEARALGGHTAVVFVDTHRSCIALSHVEVLS